LERLYGLFRGAVFVIDSNGDVLILGKHDEVLSCANVHRFAAVVRRG
jgi:hypothetical protein